MARSSIRRGTTGRRTVWANVTGQSSWVPHSCRPRAVPGTRPRSAPARMVVVVRSCRSTVGTTFFGVAVGQGVQVSADPYSGAMRRTNCGSQTRLHRKLDRTRRRSEHGIVAFGAAAMITNEPLGTAPGRIPVSTQ